MNNTNEVRIRIVDGSDLSDDLEGASRRLARVAADGFGTEAMTAERLRIKLTKNPSAVLAEVGQELVGFQVQTMHGPTGDLYLYYSRAVGKGWQGRGVAGLLLNAAIDHYRPTVVGARSQNPAEVASFVSTMSRRGVHSVYPFAAGDARRGLLDVLPSFVRRMGLADGVDADTGLCKSTYRGRLGDYVARPDYAGAAAVDDYMQAVGLDREGGDSILYFALL